MPVEEWLSERVPGWSDLHEAEKRALRDFPILWSYFEGWVTNTKTANPKLIQEKIDSQPAASFNNLNATHLAYDHYRNRFFPNGVEAPLFSTIGLTGSYRDLVKQTLLDEGSEPRQRAKAVLMLINRLRNNFLHGEKGLYNFRGQLENFSHANSTLMELLPIWGPPR